ncbi:hypothetical protein NKJ88_06125 [Mesorhizobium sp. M0016]|uniref:hypothetical protein n=1 Tax=Mesorhizobium sp. M0016 TaxID=2956843 RepID=UPI00333D653D
MLAALLSAMLISSSCSSLNKQLHDASVTKGKIEAGIDIGEDPAICGQTEKDAPLVKGVSKTVILKQQRRITHVLNNRITYCHEYRGTLREKFLNPDLKPAKKKRGAQ